MVVFGSCTRTSPFDVECFKFFLKYHRNQNKADLKPIREKNIRDFNPLHSLTYLFTLYYLWLSSVLASSEKIIKTIRNVQPLHITEKSLI